MTASLTAAGTPPISFKDDPSGYRAGACNIGPAEIARRRRIGHGALVFAVGLFVFLVAVGAPAIVRFAVAIPAAVAVACYLEVALKFCIRFGWSGLFNFSEYGSSQRVADKAARAADRRRSMLLVAGLLVVFVAVGLIAVALPV